MLTNRENRLHWLEVAIGLAGSASRLAERADLSEAYLSQVRTRSKDSKTGRCRSLGATAARKIERALRKPVGWMDQPKPATIDTSTPPPAVHAVEEIQSLFAKFQEHHRAGRLSEREVALLKAVLREMLL